jgi:cytochrome b561
MIEKVTVPPAASHYTRTALCLHWLMAVLIVGGFTLGVSMTNMAISPLKLRMFSWHKWVGITVLGLALLRVLWRLTHAPPPFIPMPAWQRLIARAVHGLLYILMLAAPLTGWAYTSAAGFPVVYLSLWRLPDLVDKSKELAAVLVRVHGLCTLALAAIVVLHAAAALQHHFIHRDDTLRRMLRWRAG